MADRIIECVDPRNFNIENLPRVCGNHVFGTIEEYKKIEALRLRKPEAVGSTISDGGPITNGSNGTNGASLSSYIPQLSDPPKILCCKAHVFRDSAGQGHFQTNEAWRVTRLFEWVNWRYEGPHPPTDVPNPPAPLISDTRIRFKLDDSDVEFYDDTTLNTSTSQAAVQAAAVARNPKTLEYINVYLTAGSLGGPSSFASLPSTTLGWDSWVVGLGAPAPQSDPNYNNDDWAGANTLAHELGHVLDLMHTYPAPPWNAPANCTINSDFLSDVFGTNPSTCPHVCDWAVDAFVQETPGPNAVVTNNLMGGNKYNFWISGLQAAMMHRALKEKSVQRYAATGCDDCVCCVAFTVRGFNDVSSGPGKVLVYATTDLNEGWGWTGGINTFVAPVPGVYHFAVSFVGDASGGTTGDVFVSIQKNGASIARARSAAAPGQRGTGSVSMNVYLGTGDLVRTLAQSGTGTTRHIEEYSFEGHLICGCC
jgi:hypothetical protein